MIMDNIIRKIQELYPVSDDSLHLLKYCFKQQTFPAKTIIIQAGRFDNQVYFIEKGITRSYILHNGKEITTWFSMEGDDTTREAAHLLNVSTRTLQRMRSEQRIGYIVLRGKCRYRRSEIDRLLADCTVAEDAATLTELKRNHTLRTGGGKPKGRRT